MCQYYVSNKLFNKNSLLELYFYQCLQSTILYCKYYETVRTVYHAVSQRCNLNLQQLKFEFTSKIRTTKICQVIELPK